MTEPLFSASRMKLQRAIEFIGEVEYEQEAYRNSDPITAKLVWKPEPVIDVRWAAVGLKPGAIIGDSIHNMRTCLDLMASELARLNGKPDKNVYFPFAASAESLDEQIKAKRFHYAGDDCVALLKQFAPYVGGNHLLRGIHDLDMRDKHTALIPTASDFGLQCTGHYDLRGPTPDESVVPILKEFSLKFPDETPFPNMPLVKTLKELVQVVEGVLEAFARLVAARGS